MNHKPIRNIWMMLFLVLVMSFLLTGCLGAQTRVTINDDGSGTYEIRMVSNPIVMEQFQYFKQHLEERNYHVVAVNEGDKQGWVATKEVESVAKEPFSQDLEKGAPPAFQDIGRGFKMEDGLFTSTLTINSEVDLSRMGKGTSDLGQLGPNLEFTLVLPTKTTENNATSVSKDGKILTWKLQPGEKTPIHVSATITNPITTGIALLLAILLLATLAFLWWRKRKRRYITI